MLMIKVERCFVFAFAFQCQKRVADDQFFIFVVKAIVCALAVFARRDERKDVKTDSRSNNVVNVETRWESEKSRWYTPVSVPSGWQRSDVY